VILALDRADDEARRFWRRVIEGGAQQDGDLKRAIAYVEDTGAIAETRARAERFAQRACAALTAALEPSPIRAALLDVAEFCVGRGY
jgi:octaprenyl-diphosphate synthase